MNPETMIRMPDAAALRRLIGGTVVGPEDDGYDAERGGFNANVDQRPALIAVPGNAEEVGAVVRFAAEHGLRVAPQRTGHNAAPMGRARRDDPAQDHAPGPGRDRRPPRRARVGSGARWGDVVPQASALGLAALHGSTPDVSVAGYSLGGGMGWYARKHGLAANSVTAIELVTADGEIRRVSHRTEPELFWALRGGGGNFGVVTALEFELFPVDEVYAGVLFFPLRAGRGGAAGVAGVDRRRPRRGDLGRPPAAVPAARGGPRAGARQIVRGRRGGLPRQPGGGRASCWRRCGRWGRRWTRSRWCRRRGSPSCTWTRATRCPRPARHALLGELDGAAIGDLVAAAGPGSGSTPGSRSSCATAAAPWRAARRTTAPWRPCPASSPPSRSASPTRRPRRRRTERTWPASRRRLRPYEAGQYLNFTEQTTAGGGVLRRRHQRPPAGGEARPTTRSACSRPTTRSEPAAEAGSATRKERDDDDDEDRQGRRGCCWRWARSSPWRWRWARRPGGDLRQRLPGREVQGGDQGLPDHRPATARSKRRRMRASATTRSAARRLKLPHGQADGTSPPPT